jgi:hypothetical protein
MFALNWLTGFRRADFSFVNYKKGCSRLAATSDKVYQLLIQGRWFSPGTPSSSTTKTGRHDITEILLKVALKHKKKIKKNQKNFRPILIGLILWRSYLDPLVYLLAKLFKLFGFPTFRF